MKCSNRFYLPIPESSKGSRREREREGLKDKLNLQNR
jgi:hypothetical protein